MTRRTLQLNLDGPTMTKAELVKLVEQVYASYRVEMPVVEEDVQILLNAWYELLHDLEYDDVRRAFLRTAVTKEFMPRPGELRRITIDSTTKVPPFDDPYVAWGKWMTLTQEVNSGMPPSVEVSEALSKTVQALGQASYNMHTNSDREVFRNTYLRIVAELEQDKYAVPDPPAKKMPPQK